MVNRYKINDAYDQWTDKWQDRVSWAVLAFAALYFGGQLVGWWMR